MRFRWPKRAVLLDEIEVNHIFVLLLLFTSYFDLVLQTGYFFLEIRLTSDLLADIFYQTVVLFWGSLEHGFFSDFFVDRLQ